MASDPAEIEIFCEDIAHELFIGALVERLSRELGRSIRPRFRCARGGRPRVMSELALYQRTVEAIPDLLIVAIDGNCHGPNELRQTIDEAIDRSKFPRRIVACPDPHIERWFMADPGSLAERFGVQVAPGKLKCERGHYKKMFAQALAEAGHAVTLGGAEFAAEIAETMNLFRAGKNEPSLKHLVDRMKTSMKELRRPSGG